MHQGPGKSRGTMADRAAEDARASLTRLRFFDNVHQIQRWTNVSVLLPVMRERDLLDLDDRRLIVEKRYPSEKFRCLGDLLEEKGPQAYVEFHLCVRDEDTHLGHHYVAQLLEGKDLSPHSDTDIAESSKVQESIRVHERELQESVNVFELGPHLLKAQLATKNEVDSYFSKGSASQLTRDDRVQKLLATVDSKGPTAHSLFLRCLSEEKNHSGHQTLCDLLSTHSHTTASPSLTPSRCRLQGTLAGSQYVDTMRELQQHRYRGRWTNFTSITKKLMADRRLDKRVFGMLAQAVASIISGNTAESLTLAKEALDICIKGRLHHNNSTIMKGRALYVQSAVYRHLKNYDLAEKYLIEASQVLEGVVDGEDTASIHYHWGALLLERLAQNPSEKGRVKAAEEFSKAVDHAEQDSSGLPLIGYHSRILSALLHIGSSHRCPGESEPKREDLDRSYTILKGLDPKLLPDRTKALYYVAWSDVYMWMENTRRATDRACMARDIAVMNGFAYEEEYAEKRLNLLRLR